MPPRREPARGAAARVHADRSAFAGLGRSVVDFVANLGRSEVEGYLSALSGALGPWLKAMAMHGAPRVKANLARGLPCGAENERAGVRSPCDQPAGLQCAACGAETCLFHAFLTWKGDALCWHCVNATVVRAHEQGPSGHPGGHPGWRRPDVPPPRGHDVPNARFEAEVDRSLALLGLTRRATWEDVVRAYKFVASTNHPDRVAPEHKEAAEARLKHVNAAYAFLKEIGWGKGREARGAEQPERTLSG